MLALSGATISTLLEIQNQFIGSTVQHHSSSFFPLTLLGPCSSNTLIPCSSTSQPSSAMVGPFTYGTSLTGLSMSMSLKLIQEDTPKINKRSTSSSLHSYTMHCSGTLLGGQVLRRTGSLFSPTSWIYLSASF